MRARVYVDAIDYRNNVFTAFVGSDLRNIKKILNITEQITYLFYNNAQSNNNSVHG